jgi:hypothetical protein
MLFNPTTTKEEISGGGGKGIGKVELFSLFAFASCLFRFLSRLPLEGIM